MLCKDWRCAVTTTTNRRSPLTALRKALIANLIALPLVMYVYSTPSCGGAAGQIISNAGSDWLACMEADSGGAIGQAVTAIEALGALNTATLEADALALIGSLGFDAVDCAVKIVEEVIAAATSTGSGGSASASSSGSGSAAPATIAGFDRVKLTAGVVRIRAVVEHERPKHAAAAHK